MWGKSPCSFSCFEQLGRLGYWLCKLWSISVAVCRTHSDTGSDSLLGSPVWLLSGQSELFLVSHALNQQSDCSRNETSSFTASWHGQINLFKDYVIKPWNFKPTASLTSVFSFFYTSDQKLLDFILLYSNILSRHAQKLCFTWKDSYALFCWTLHYFCPAVTALFSL